MLYLDAKGVKVMPASVTHIVKDTSRGSTTFLVRMYGNVKDIGVRVPIDSYEANLIIVDSPTLDYLNNLESVTQYRRRHESETD
jgi:hypothetical protein